MVIHDARRLRRLAHRMADVEALDAHMREVVALHAERVDEARVRRLLRALLRQEPREREPRVLLGHREPRAALALRLTQHGDLVPGLLDQYARRVRAWPARG